MSEKQIQWGIFGSGSICFDFCVALSTLDSSEHKIEHIAARDLQRAKDFADNMDIRKYSDSYTKLAEDPEVDVIYIGTINSTHKDLSILAMNHGKSVLCEKPVSMNSKELEEVLNCAKRNQVFFMEALWTRFFPLWRQLLDEIKSKKYGEPNVLFTEFGYHGLFERDRINNPALGGSVLLDIGVYALTTSDMVFGNHKLKNLKASGHIEPTTGIDRSVCINILYEENKSVQLQANGDHTLSNNCKIYFDDYIITIDAPFWCPESITIEHRSTGKMEKREDFLPKGKYPVKYQHSEGLRYEAAHVRECILAKKLESEIMSHTTSRRIMGYLDDIRQQISARR